MIAKRVMGFIMLVGMGYMGYTKLEDSMYQMHDGGLILFLVLLVVIFLVFAVRKIILH